MKSSSVALPVTRSLPLTMPCVTLWGDAEGVAHGQDDVADRQFVAVRERQRREIIGLDLDDGHVGFFIRADELGGEFPSVREGDADFFCVLGIADHVTIGQDVAVGRDDDAGTEAILARAKRILIARCAPAALLLTEKSLEEVGFVIGHLLSAGTFRADENLDNTRSDLLHDGCETARRSVAAVHRRVLDFDLRHCGVGGFGRRRRVGQCERRPCGDRCPEDCRKERRRLVKRFSGRR